MDVAFPYRGQISNLLLFLSKDELGDWLKQLEKSSAQYTQAVFHRLSGSAPRGTEGTWISLKISRILSVDMVSIFFSILNSCDAIKSQCASRQKWLRFRNERNNRCVQLADEFVMCSGILFHAVNSNYISSCA